MSEPVMETRRLKLEPLRVDHAEEMADVLADPRLYEFTGDNPPALADLKRRYELQAVGRSADGSEEWLNWIVRVADDGHAIGFVQATIVAARADIAWVIGTPWQGRGYAAEAARAMVEFLVGRGIREVTAHIRADHAASAAVATRLGLSPSDEIEDGEVVWRAATHFS